MARRPRTPARKLILKSGYSPGDIVMMTAAVRDLHCCHPGEFVTDVRTRCPELWENNPQLTPLKEEDPGVEQIPCEYPLINLANETPYHCLHGYIEFLNGRLGTSIKPTLFKGDIHLSDLEKAWASQVYELARLDIPFWIVAAGGKYDVPIKWWSPERYQAVIDQFRGRIQFVQVGAHGNHHPKLDGVIDLRGRTTLRELVRLVYHSQGVLGPVTSVMHLAAAVEVKGYGLANRPCVVIAGGREPAHWEAYPDHQFIHTTGTLSCCSGGGCWKDRVVPLGDGDERDGPDHLCVDVRGQLPHCMAAITADEVVRRIRLYFDGGVLNYLSVRERRAAHGAVKLTERNTFDTAPLNLHSARLACHEFLEKKLPPRPTSASRGVVICGGGIQYFTNAWVCIAMLRHLGCTLPIELWHLGPHEVDHRMEQWLRQTGTRCVDASRVRQRHPVRALRGWALKPYAVLHSRFREVLFLDADNVPVVNPEFLFKTPQFRRSGAIFWPDYGQDPKGSVIWESCDLPRPEEPEFETGQMVLDKRRCWQALHLTMWFNEHADFYYEHLYGDKETFHLAFRKVSKSFALVPVPIHSLSGTMCQHDFNGRRIFQHRNTAKWALAGRNPRVKDFWLEDVCLQALEQLKKKWDGRIRPQR